MGEAKRRGNYEQRKIEGEYKKAAKLKDVAEKFVAYEKTLTLTQRRNRRRSESVLAAAGILAAASFVKKR